MIDFDYWIVSNWNLSFSCWIWKCNIQIPRDCMYNGCARILNYDSLFILIVYQVYTNLIDSYSKYYVVYVFLCITTLWICHLYPIFISFFWHLLTKSYCKLVVEIFCCCTLVEERSSWIAHFARQCTFSKLGAQCDDKCIIAYYPILVGMLYTIMFPFHCIHFISE